MKFQIVNNNISIDLLLDTLRAAFEKHGVERVSGASLYFAGPRMDFKFKVDKDALLLQESTEEEIREIRF